MFLLQLVLLAAPEPNSSPQVRAMLANAQGMFQNLEYGQVVPLAASILAREDVGIQERLDAYVLQGSSLAIIGNTTDAEKPFRFVLRGRPDFDLSPDTPPKILAVFRKVQAEENAIVQQMRELERARIIKALTLTGDSPRTGLGGQPLRFEYVLKDPLFAVAEMKVEYRRAGSPSFSSLALTRDDLGRWMGELPAELTASEEGFEVEYYLSTSDDKGTRLLSVASAQQPLIAKIEPGSVSDSRAFYSTPWFWVATAAVVAGGVTGLIVAVKSSSDLPATDLGEVPLP